MLFGSVSRLKLHWGGFMPPRVLYLSMLSTEKNSVSGTRVRQIKCKGQTTVVFFSPAEWGNREEGVVWLRPFVGVRLVRRKAPDKHGGWHGRPVFLVHPAVWHCFFSLLPNDSGGRHLWQTLRRVLRQTKVENYAFYFKHRLFIGLCWGRKPLGGGCATQSRAADSLEYSTLEDWPLFHGTAVSAIFWQLFFFLSLFLW